MFALDGMWWRAIVATMNTNAPLHTIVRPALALALAVAAIFSTASTAHAELDAQAAFEKLKSLSGDWAGPKMEGMPHATNQNYRVIAGGSAVKETCFPGTDMEMVSLYYLKGNDLVMQHYCVMGNQPRMKLNTKKSTADTLVFDFDGGDNIKSTQGHMHSATLHFVGANKIEMSGVAKEKGKPDQTCTNTLTRKR